MFNPANTTLIPYTPPLSPMEFIKAEVERGIRNGTISIEQVSHQGTIPRSLPLTVDLNELFKNLNKIKLKPEIKKIQLPSSPATCRLLSSSHSLTEISLKINDLLIDQPTLIPNSSRPLFDFPSSSPIFSENFSLDFLEVSNRTSRVSSSTPLNGDEIVEALQSEAAFTIATDKKPVVTTYGCGPCVAVGGYDPVNKIAFIVHFSNAGEVRESGGVIFYNISRLAKNEIRVPVQLHLRGGVEGQSEETIKAIRQWMTWRNDIPMEIASEDILGSGLCFDRKSLSIDSRDGKVMEYNPMDNPKSRDITELNAMVAIMSAYNPKITVHYRPEI